MRSFLGWSLIFLVLTLSGFVTYLMVRGLIALYDWWWNDAGTAQFLTIPVLAALLLGTAVAVITDKGNPL